MEKFYKVRESELLELLEAWHIKYMYDYDIAEERYIKEWCRTNPNADNVTDLDGIVAYNLKSFIEVS